MIRSLLVANRGEIACRIFRTARRLGIRTIAVYSDADVGAMHVAMADESVCLGAARASESYLNITKIIDAAVSTQAQAVHPGYGFLSENSGFAQACLDAGLIFVGPSPEAIELMGSKIASKQVMEAAGVPVLPGYHGTNQDADFLRQQAQAIGFPLLIKASAGGGGRGMRRVDKAEEFMAQLAGAQREARAAFDDDAVLLERYLDEPKHIEVQLMADNHGNVIHLFERDCSVQRRHQKVVEEAPGPWVDALLRSQLGQSAIEAAKQVGYVGAGTVEFIVQDGAFFFMEMNTRLQVEHPVTEAITGLDLVEMQLDIAANQMLSVGQEDVQMQGHAVEVRLYAENPAKHFLPSTGKLVHFALSEQIRVDAGVCEGDRISPYYDPMLAKLIAHGATRQIAIRSLITALRSTRIAGVEHNLGYIIRVLEHADFLAGDYTTHLLPASHEAFIPRAQSPFAALAALSIFLQEADNMRWSAGSGFRSNAPCERQIHLLHKKQVVSVSVHEQHLSIGSDRIDYQIMPGAHGQDMSVQLDGVMLQAKVARDASALYVMSGGHTEKFLDLTDDLSRFQDQSLSLGGIIAPMPGQLIAVHVREGDSVQQGDVLAVLEAMKMEHTITAPKAGIVLEVFCGEGERVDEGVTLVALD